MDSYYPKREVWRVKRMTLMKSLMQSHFDDYASMDILNTCSLRMEHLICRQVLVTTDFGLWDLI